MQLTAGLKSPDTGNKRATQQRQAESKQSQEERDGRPQGLNCLDLWGMVLEKSELVREGATENSIGSL